MTNSLDPHQVTLQVLQQAIADLLGENLPNGYQIGTEADEVKLAKELLGLSNAKVDILALLFDRIKLPEGKGKTSEHYAPLPEINCKLSEYPNIPYPKEKKEKPDQKNELQAYQVRIANEIKDYLNSNRWNDLSFLTFILEKYGSCVSYGD